MSLQDIKPHKDHLGSSEDRRRKEKEERKRYDLNQQKHQERMRLLSKKQKLEMIMLKRDCEQIEDREEHSRLDAKLALGRAIAGVEVTKGPAIELGQHPCHDVSKDREGAEDGTGSESDGKSVVFVEENILPTCVVKDAKLVKTEFPSYPSPGPALGSVFPPYSRNNATTPSRVKVESDSRSHSARKGRRNNCEQTPKSVQDDLESFSSSSTGSDHESQVASGTRARRRHRDQRGREGKRARRDKQRERSPSDSRDDNSADVSESEDCESGTDGLVDSEAESDCVPEFWIHYPGPILTKLSIDILDRHLSQELEQGRLSIKTLGELAKWWPKTKIAYRHGLDKHQVWILTHGVTLWWERLLDDVERPNYRWPRSIATSADKKSMRLRIEEIYCEKKKHSMRAEREMKEVGRPVSANKLYRLEQV